MRRVIFKYSYYHNPSIEMKEERLARQVKQLKESPRLEGDSWMYFEGWLKEKSPQTKVHYLNYLIGFMEWIDTDTEGLYELYKEMTSDTDTRKKKKMGMLVVDYQNHLIETKGIKGGTSNTVSMAVKGFFDANELIFKRGERLTHDTVETPNISLEQISKVLSATGSYKIKANIKVSRDSGLRTADVANLPIRVVRAPLDDPDISYHTFECKQKKTGKIANPVLGPDSLESLRKWMNYRVNTLEISAEDGDPLFCVESYRKGYTKKSNNYVNEVVKGDKMDDSNMSVIFYQLVRKADLKPLIGNTRLPSIHSLRVFHKTTLEYSGVPTSWVNKMQGRAGEGTGGTYTKPSPEQLIEMFKRGYPKICGIPSTTKEDESEKWEYEVVTEKADLTNYLNKGWIMFKELNDGSVILRHYPE
ncbi:hypothetical protein ES703_20546 [subsurface metagenome]